MRSNLFWLSDEQWKGIARWAERGIWENLSGNLPDVDGR